MNEQILVLYNVCLKKKILSNTSNLKNILLAIFKILINGLRLGIAAQ